MVCDAVPRYAIVCTNCDLGLCLVPIFRSSGRGVLISGEAAVDLRRSYGALIAGSLALVANSGAYICEIFRAGIQSLIKAKWKLHVLWV